jgi:phosphate transport system substrate-binding protein
VYFPTLLGAVTVPVNVEGVSRPLRLTGAASGHRLRRGHALERPGHRCHQLRREPPRRADLAGVRADSSGTSFNFSAYLAKVSPAFETKVAASATPIRTAATVQRAPGQPGRRPMRDWHRHRLRRPRRRRARRPR